jgi:hypothetical protein
VPYAPKPPPSTLYIKGVSPHRNQVDPFPSLYVPGTGIAGSSGAVGAVICDPRDPRYIPNDPRCPAYAYGR